MNILLYSHAFDPSVGGVETVSRTLAEGFAARGLGCKVVTPTPGPGALMPFDVVRQPARAQLRELLRWADVVLFNGATMSLQPWVLLARKPFVWVHVGYQAASIDGAGWVDGARAPLTPWASTLFHARRSGWKFAAKDGLKLLIRRFFAKRMVTRNVAITHWMDRMLPLPRQVQIYNPFPIEQFRAADGRVPDHDFFYVGRIVQEKGIDTLVRAFAELRRDASGAAARLLLIGDGTARPAIEALVDELDVRQAVTFAGRQSGNALVDWVGRGRIGVLPSVWYEPMGGVAVELLAAGKCLIVSEQGGLAECVGDAGLTFPNGDPQALAQRMRQLLADPALQQNLSNRARERARDFAPDALIDRYVALLREVADRG